MRLVKFKSMMTGDDGKHLPIYIDANSVKLARPSSMSIDSHTEIVIGTWRETVADSLECVIAKLSLNKDNP